MKNTIQRSFKREWTGPIDNIREIRSAYMG